MLCTECSYLRYSYGWHPMYPKYIQQLMVFYRIFSPNNSPKPIICLLQLRQFQYGVVLLVLINFFGLFTEVILRKLTE